MIPYGDIPIQLLITHPLHKTAHQQAGGHARARQVWQESWGPFVLTEKSLGRSATEIAVELGITSETVRAHLRELES